MAVISGRLELSIAGRETVSLSSDSTPVSFSGDLPASAEPVQPPVIDLNVMTRRGAFVARLRRCRASASATLRLEAQITLVLALLPLTLHAPCAKGTLCALDAVRLSPDRRPPGHVSIEGAAVDFWLIEIAATAE
jgi:environmental stress-induced protein Ves